MRSVTDLLDLLALALFAAAAAVLAWTWSPGAGLAGAGLVVLTGAFLADRLKGGDGQ